MDFNSGNHDIHHRSQEVKKIVDDETNHDGYHHNDAQLQHSKQPDFQLQQPISIQQPPPSTPSVLIPQVPPPPSRPSIANLYPHQPQQQHHQMSQYHYPQYTSQYIHPYPPPAPPLQQHHQYTNYPALHPLPPPSSSIPTIESTNRRKHSSWILPITLAASAGTLIGVSVAATIRWLNGEDWYLVYPNMKPQCTEKKNNSNEPQVLGMMEDPTSTLLQTTKSSSEAQQLTDEVMEYLRQQKRSNDADSNNNIESPLRDIRQSLISIQESMNVSQDQDSDHQDVELQSHLSSVLMQLDDILDIRKKEACTISPPLNSILDVEPTQIPDASPIEDPDPTKILELDKQVVCEEPTVAPPARLISTTRLELREAVTKLVMGRSNRPTTDFVTGVQSLYLFTWNLSRQPHVPRYRRIYCNNENYRNHVHDVVGASDVLTAVGFIPSEPIPPHNQTFKFWDWLPSSSSRQKLNSPEIPDDTIEAIYLERVREAVVALEVIKTALPDTDIPDLIQKALTVAQLMDDDMKNDS